MSVACRLFLACISLLATACAPDGGGSRRASGAEIVAMREEIAGLQQQRAGAVLARFKTGVADAPFGLVTPDDLRAAQHDLASAQVALARSKGDVAGVEAALTAAVTTAEESVRVTKVLVEVGTLRADQALPLEIALVEAKLALAEEHDARK